MKVITLLRTFSKKEISLCRKFLTSPSAKSEQKILELYNYLVVSYPKFDAPRLSNERVFRKLFPKSNFNKRKLENLYAALVRSLKDFLAARVSADDELKDMLDRSQGLGNKGLYEEANKINKEIQEKINSHVNPVKGYAVKIKQLANLQYNYFVQDYNFGNISEGIGNLSRTAVLGFVFDFINIKAEMKTTFDNYGKNIENEISKNVFDKINIEKWLKLFEESDYVSKLHVELYYCKFKTVEEENNYEHYFKLKELLLKNLKALDRLDRWSFFMHLFNYASLKGDKNVPRFRKEGFRLLKDMFESNSFSPSEDQFLNMQIFRCVILSSGNEEDADWLDYFIEKYSRHLDPAHFDNLFNYANAHLLCLRNEFDRSMEFASKIKDEYFFFKTDVATLYLRTYFELGEINRAVYALDAFKHFINNNKNIFDDYKVIFLTFIKFYESLLKVKSGDDKIDLLFIREELEKENNLACKYWLIKKADELIKPNVNFEVAF